MTHRTAHRSAAQLAAEDRATTALNAALLAVDHDVPCRQDPGTWFPEGAGPARADVERQAVSLCTRCPVGVECLEYALTSDERYGIWGGTTETDRATMRPTA